MPLFRRETPVDRTYGDPRAAAVLEAAEAEDVDRLRQAMSAGTTPEERERLSMVLATVSGRAALFDAWVERDPDSADAWMARGAHGVGWAWEARGRAGSEHVRRDAFEVFFERLRRAEESLMRAVHLAPEDPVPWTHLLISGRGLQVPKEEQWMRYEESKARHPWLSEAQLQMLQYLCAKWFGSDVESLEFAGTVAREAPDSSPALAVVPMAHIEIWLALHSRDRGNPDGYIHGPEVRQQIHDVAERSVYREDFPIDLTTVRAANVFAFAIYLMGGEGAARQIVKRLGTRRTEFPWGYHVDDGQLYKRLSR